MASLTTRGNSRLVQFYDADKRKRSVTLGKVPLSFARDVQRHVELLNTASIMGTRPPGETVRWVGQQSRAVVEKLAAVDLVDSPADIAAEDPFGEISTTATIGESVAAYIAARTDIGDSTKITYRHVERNLIAFFGRGKLLMDVTEADSEDFRRWLAAAAPAGQGLSENTIRKHMDIARRMFRYAVRKRMLADNPFAESGPTNVTANPDRDHHVTRSVTARLLETCPCSEWRLIIALSRYGGLRCPSETLRLRWGDIAWSEGRMMITSPKTKRYKGGGSRVVPIFPELLPYLEAAFDDAPAGSEFCINRYRDTSGNLRTQL